MPLRLWVVKEGDVYDQICRGAASNGTSVPFFTSVLGGLCVGPIKQDSLGRKSEAVLFCVCHVLAALDEEELAFVTGLFEGLDEVLFLCAVGFEKGHLVLYVDFSDGNFVSRCLAVDDADELIGTQVVFGADVDECVDLYDCA